MFILIIDVDIHWHERDSMVISPVHEEDFGIGGLAKYEVSRGTMCCVNDHNNNVGFSNPSSRCSLEMQYN